MWEFIHYCLLYIKERTRVSAYVRSGFEDTFVFFGNDVSYSRPRTLQRGALACWGDRVGAGTEWLVHA